MPAPMPWHLAAVSGGIAGPMRQGGQCWVNSAVEHPQENPNGTFGYWGSCGSIPVPNTRTGGINGG